MKKIFLLITALSCASGLYAQGISCQLPNGIGAERAFHVLQEQFSLTAKQDLAFDRIQTNYEDRTISTEIKTLKLRRKTPRIGEFPEVHRPKWKKERIQLKAFLIDGVLTVSLKASAYNKRDKKWHPVHSTGRYEAMILEGAFTELLEGIQGTVMGSPMATGPSGTMKLKNLDPFTITGAYVSLDGMKTLVIDLTDRKNVTYKISIPFLGSVANICSAIEDFFSKFTTRDLKANVPQKYDYYWPYAVDGELMDGMHRNQVLAAAGKPDEKIKIKKDTEQWIYRTGKSSRKLTIADGELHIP